MEKINDIDVNLINKRAFDTARRIQGNNTEEIQKNLVNTNKYYDHVNKQATQRAFKTNNAVSNLLYHKNTDLVAQMNESWNTNRHFHLTLDKEASRLDKGNKTAKVDVYRMRQEELQLEYTRNLYKFSVLGEDDILARSVCEVKVPRTFDGNDPVPDGLFDPRMGVIDNRKLCVTCHQRNTFCPGHFGHITLAQPCFYVQFYDIVKKLMTCVCFRCSKLLVDADVPEVHTMLTKKTPVSNMRRWDTVTKLCARVKRCGASTKNGPRRAHERRRSRELILTAEDTLRILRRITDEDCAILGLDPRFARPERFICTHLPVPPPSVRPSVRHESGQRQEDDLTHKLADIVKVNNMILEKIAKGGSAETVEKNGFVLQYHVATLIDNNTSLYPAKDRSGRSLRSLSERLGHKEGRIRGNLMGKRVDFSARTVITPDPNLSIDELGVPKRIAMNLTFPEVVNQYNIEELKLLVENGADQYPGAKHVRKADGVGGSGGRTIRLKEHPSLREVVANLDIGDVVERHLRNGDYVLFNRQPSLHKMSMMAHRVRVMPYNTFRLNVCVCACYNADFDGDEMNMHVPQSLQTHHELQALAAVPLHVLSPRYSKPIISIVQDVALGVYRITQKNIQIPERQLFNLVAPNPTADARTLPGRIQANGETMASGRELLSTVLPPTLNTYLINENKDVGDDNFIPEDDEIRIERGKIKSGVLNAAVFGRETTGIVHSVFNTEGPEAVTLMLNNTQKLICDWLVLSGFSVGISDLWIPEETRIAIRAELDSAKKNVRELLRNVHEGTFENVSTRSNADFLEESITVALKKGEETAGKLALSGTDPDTNSVLNMIASGSKGKQVNFTQMISCLGGQSMEGQRVPYGFEGRTLPHFTKYDDGPEARGFVEHSFIEGLTPHEFFFHYMAGRIGLIDTAVRSVTWETPIVVLEDGQAKYVRIGEWVDEHLAREAEDVQHFPEESNLELLEIKTTVHIPTLDSDGVVTWGAMTAVTRHDPGERLYKVTTQGGREVTVAESKSLLVWNSDEEKFEEKDSPHVNVGDYLPVTMRLAEPPLVCTHVDFSDFFPKTEYVYGTDFNIAIRMVADAQGAKFHIPSGWWSEHNGKEFTLPYDKKAKLQRATSGEPFGSSWGHDHEHIFEDSDDDLSESLLISAGRSETDNIRDGCVYPFHASRCHGHIPSRFELDFEFGVFVGLYLADGHTCEKSGVVGISKNEKGVQEFVEEWFTSKLGLKTWLSEKTNDRGTSMTLFGYSSLLARFLDRFVGHGSHNKHVPDIAYIAPLAFVRGLLNGYFSGDGTIERGAVSSSSVSRRLNEGISMLCTRIGVFGKISTLLVDNHLRNEMKPLYRLNIRAQWATKLRGQLGDLVHPAKNLALKSMRFSDTHTNYKEHNDVVLDPIKSIDIIGVEDHPKLYDVTVPSTLNFILANGLGCRDTSDTGYIQRKLIKAMEDCKVHHDRTVRNANGHVVQFLYGEDGMNATSLEFHSLPYMTLASPADMRPEYLLATREEVLEIDPLGSPPSSSTLARLVTHFKQLVDDRRFVIETLCHGRSEDVPITYPVNFSRIVEDSSALLGAKSSTDELAGPDSILDTIDDLISAMVCMQEERHQDLFQRRWPPILLRSFLSPKVLMRRFHMTRSALARVSSEILREFRKAIATPGEMRVSKPLPAATSGVPRLRELLSMTKKIKTPTMALQLRPEHSASIERAKDVMSDIQTTLLKDVVRSSAIYFDPHDDERSVVLADHGLLAFHKKYCLLVNNNDGVGVQSSPWLMRLELDRERMLECNVRMIDVEVALGNMYGENVSCILADDNARELVCRVRLSTSSGDEDLLTDVKALHQSMMEACVIKGVVGISKAVLAKPAQGLKRFDPLTDSFVKNDTWSILTAGSNLVEVLSKK
eukprot:gene14612-biopygen23657